VLLAAEYFDEPPALAVVWQRRSACQCAHAIVPEDVMPCVRGLAVDLGFLPA
jgi:hypothetical protein